ncbi:probable cytochrome P450 313a4 [Culicoides brevitarsis]|uniref:probable cytochrome P450 313a4 n=1 Tax=Culicoides brevitarsis TaxID=469753 RepID=UPI00307B1951
MPFITKLMLLKDCSPKIFTPDAVKDEIDTLVVGGNETTGLTLAFTLLMLGMHPDIQERVYQEICSNNVEEDPTYDTLTRLTYMEMVIKETLRHFAVGPVIGRKATANVKLNKYTIPKGAQLVICSYSIHRNPKFWGPDVLKFDPERFSAENSKNRHPFCYIPFSGGPRNCIGIKYAWISMKLVLWHLLKKYRIHTSLKWEELKLMISVTLKLVNRHLISVELR